MSGRLDTFAWPKSARGLREALDRHVGAQRVSGIRFEARRSHGSRTVRIDLDPVPEPLRVLLGAESAYLPLLLPLTNESKERE